MAAQAASRGPVRYDISFDPVKGRWYLDASWKTARGPVPSLEDLRRSPVLAADLNHGHLAAWIVLPDGNPAGPPVTVPLDLAGLPASQRDGRLRDAVSTLVAIARGHGCHAIAIEDLHFTDAREQGRERTGRRPSRGRRGRGYRRMVAGIPTARFRDRLTQGHHGAAVVIGRRAHGHRARRREGVTSGEQRIARRRAAPTAPKATRATRDGGTRQAPRQPPRRRKTVQAQRDHPPDQAAPPPFGAAG